MRRLAVLVLTLATTSLAEPAKRQMPQTEVGATSAAPLHELLFADTDDDDDDGVADKDEGSPARAHDVEWMRVGGDFLAVRSAPGPSLRIIPGEGTAAGTVGFQGLAAGVATVDLGSRLLNVSVCDVRAMDAERKTLDLATSHASLSRTLPPLLAKSVDGSIDRDALSWMAVCPRGAVPAALKVASLRPNGDGLDEIPSVALVRGPCPDGVRTGFDCGETGPIRATVDVADRSYPSTVGLSLRAEVGGRLVLFPAGDPAGRKAASIRVGGPRETVLGAVGRYRARLFFHLVRVAPGGAVPVGGDDDGARAIARAEARTASMLWGQCGIHFGADADVQVEVVDPPPPYLLAIGCDVGLPATGGVISFRADGKTVHVKTRALDAPLGVAMAVARAIEAQGLSAVVSPNSRIAPGAMRTADVLVRRHDGSKVELSKVDSEPLSTDQTLSACIGEVNLSDGLEHFDDLDAAAGTLEERTLVKAYQDTDPTTIDVFIVPSFSKTGRIGESFIDGDGSGIQNVVLVDRTGIRAGSRSYALPHELGHVLLDLPGHPDDFGVDRPWMLMDADATDASIFGPRRLTNEDCERALRESGPGAAVPLLTPWPLYKAARK